MKKISKKIINSPSKQELKKNLFRQEEKNKIYE